MQLLMFALKIRVPVLVIGIIIISALLIYAIISAIKEKKQGDPELEKLDKEAEEDITLTEAHGIICKMECGERAGGRISSTVEKFFIEFRDDDGNEKGYFVSEEAYLALDTDIPGTLATVNGRFYGFCYDEEADTVSDTEEAEGEGEAKEDAEA